MSTATALPTAENLKPGFCRALGRIITSCFNGRGMPPDRVRVNTDKDGQPLPIRQHRTTAKRVPTNNLIPGIPLLTKGTGTDIKYYVEINKKTFYVDASCHLLDITKADEDWKKAVTKAKGIDYDGKCQAILAYAENYYHHEGKMPALQRLCVDVDIRRDELFERFKDSPRRTIAMIIGAPTRFETEPLKKAPEIPFW